MKEKLLKLKHIFISPSLKSILKWTKRYRSRLLLLSLGQMLAAGLGLVFTVATRGIVDSAVGAQKAGMIKYAVLLVSTVLMQVGMSYLLNYGNVRVSAVMRREIRSSVTRNILGKQYSEIADKHSGDLTGRILNDTDVIVRTVVSVLPSLLFLVTQFMGAAILLLTMAPGFVFVLIGFGILGACLTLVAGQKMKRFHKVTREKEDGVLACVQENMQNIRIIKASETEERVKNNIWKLQTDFVAAQLERGRYSSALNACIHLAFRFGWLYTMIWGCNGILRGLLSYGSLTAMLQLVGQIQSPIANVATVISQVYGAISSAERIDEVVNLKNEESESDNALTGSEIYAGVKEIRIEDLCFAYDREQVITNKTLTVKPGDITAITGYSGCGKSTFFMLLLGLYKPESGKIEFDTEKGVITAGRLSRRMFSYVPQGNALFSGTLRDNICMFKPEATDEEIDTALKKACIYEFVDSLEAKTDTVIGEKGLGLSEGQAQRIALARAILSDAPILLLDEATSALDEKTEETVLRNIQEMKNRTCLIVTHRPAALSICNNHIEFGNA